MSFLLMILLSAMVQYFLPWWSVALVPFGISAWKGTSGKTAFFNGFFSAGLLWLGLAYYEHQRSGGILTERISSLFQGVGTPGLLATTALIGALVGGFASMSGFFLRRLISPRPCLKRKKPKPTGDLPKILRSWQSPGLPLSGICLFLPICLS